MTAHDTTGSQVPLVKRTFVLGIINGAGFIFGWSLLNPSTVLPVLVKELMGEKMIYLGLMTWVMNSGWFWPQVLLQNVYETRPRKLAYYTLSAVVRTAAWALITALLWWGQTVPRPLIYSALVVLLFIYTSGGGFGTTPFWDIVAKSIPANRRSSFLGIRQFLGGLLAIFVGGMLIRACLEPRPEWPFPRNYGVLALVGFVVITFALVAFCLVREPVRTVHSHHLPLRRQLRRGPRIFRRDSDVRGFIYVRALATLAGALTFPFLFRFMTDELNTPIAAAGYFTSVQMLSSTVSNIVWSYVGDRYGSRSLLQWTTVLVLAVPVAALAGSLLPTDPLFRLYGLVFSQQFLAMTGAFLLLGVAATGQALAEINYLMEIAPERKRPTYLGINALVTTVLAASPVLGAMLIGDARRFALGFWISAALALGALYAARRLRNPRDTSTPAEGETAEPEGEPVTAEPEEQLVGG